MDIRSTKQDASLVSGGQWVDEIPQMDDLRLRVRGMTSPQALTLRSRLERQAKKADRNRDGSLKYEASMKIMNQVLHEAVLLEWEHLTDGGETVPYSKEKALEYLSDPDYRAFADAVSWAAVIVDNGNADVTGDLAANLPKPSAGK